MFREPDENVAEEAAAKLDRAAATQRSAIRRQPTIRPLRHDPDAQRRQLRVTEQRQRDRSERPSERDDAQHTDLHIAQLEAELERLRQIRVRQRFRSNRLSRPVLRDAMDLMRQSREMFGDEDENDTRAPSPVRRLPRPVRESNLRFEVESSPMMSPRRWRMMSPPSSSGSGRNVDGPLDEPRNLTLGFAPASGPYTEDDMPTPPPESWEASYPPLSRVGRASPRYSRVDGLGDRRRSPGPDEEEETWANLLTTMEHGSTATSFDSEINRSRASQNAATSFGEIGQLDDSCDLDLAPGITEDDARAIREHHRSVRPDGPVMTGERGLREHQSRRLRRGELGRFQSILERMQRREDIPDEMWAAVGLTPDVV